jgi:hypothetical protein
MQVDFRHAARRHFADGEALRDERRFANADHLYGFAAECALKAILSMSGAEQIPSGELEDKHFWVHVHVLWDEVFAAVEGRAVRFLAPLSGYTLNPFANWHERQRYAAQESEPRGGVVEKHRQAARSCMTALGRASENWEDA